MIRLRQGYGGQRKTPTFCRGLYLIEFVFQLIHAAYMPRNPYYHPSG